jgi:ribosomal protein L11 methylase PrmA
MEADLGSLSLSPADLVTANLTAAVLERFAQPLFRLVKSGGTLVISGFGPQDAGLLARPFAEFLLLDTLHEGSWTAQRLQRSD